MWKKEWRTQPAVPIELIRKVERQTVYMRLGKWVLLLPLAILLFVTAGAVMDPTPVNIILAVGLWLLSIILNAAEAGRNKLRKKLLAPAAETTAAYVELSIERCRVQSEGLRVSKIAMVPMWAFISAAQYSIFYKTFVESGEFGSNGYWIVIAGLAIGLAPLPFVYMGLARAERKERAELDYLLKLKGQVEGKEE